MKVSLCLQRLLFAASLCLAGCAAYQPAPLPLSPPLVPSLAALNHQLPSGGVLPLAPPLTIQTVAALAILNNPDLAAARAQHGIAVAQLLGAGLPPDPSITAGFEAFISGPANVPSISAGLAQDISALITYRVDKLAARSGLAQVDAGILWQEWQLASLAEQLCITIAADRALIASLAANQTALREVNTNTQAQVATGNLTINESAATQTALAATDTAANTAAQTLQQDTSQLDALLGLQPDVTFAIAAPRITPVNPAAAAAIATLARRRPDLIALRYGYQQADAKLRAAILSQFLPVSLGAAGGRDTSRVVSAGPQITLTLPLFNRNRAAIALTTATRAQLAAQFTSSLATAQGNAETLLARITILQTQSDTATHQANIASGIAGQAAQAYANGSINELAAVNLQTAATDRAREAIALSAQLQTAQLSFATLLGLGLPPIAQPDMEPLK